MDVPVTAVSDEEVGRKLFRLDGVPLHRQLFLILQSAIQSGQYRRGDLFPTEEVLAKTYAVSRATVRRTLASLEGAGLIDRRQGAGTRVAGGPSYFVEDSALETHLRSFSVICENTRLELLSAEFVPTSPYLSEVLGLAEGEEVLRLRRVRHEDSVPVWYSFAYVTPRVAARLAPEDYAQLSFLNLIENAGVTLGEVDQTVGARLADADMAAVLGVEIGAALLEMFLTFIDSNGDPVSFQRTYTPPERRRLRFARRARNPGIV
jgi:GntR family transcriptional regulator